MSTIYVVEPNARLEKEYGRLLVTREDEVLLRVPLGAVSRVVLVGWAGATTPALHALLAAGIPLVLVGRNGRLLGRLLPPTPPNLPLRVAQYGRDADDAFCFRLARALVAGKLRNQRTLVARLGRRRGAPEDGTQNEWAAAAAALRVAGERAAACENMASLRGIEGAAAAAYFRAYRATFDPEWRFRRRNRRPPRDPVNALLSLGYSFLTQAMMAALEVVGLDPYLGYYHSEAYGRPALALDLVEEFRAPVVDSLVLDMVSHGLLRPDDFEPGEDGEGIVLSRRGLRLFARKFSGKLESTVTPRAIGRRLSYRKLFEVQARALARAVGDGRPYRSFQAR